MTGGPPTRITTSRRPRPGAVARAHALAERWGLTWVEPGASDDAPLLLLARDGLRLRWQGAERRWHPGMLHALRAAGADHPLVRLTGLAPGHTVIDSTLGLGTDAIFLSERTGRTVLGIERVPALAAMAEDGLAAAGHDVRVLQGEATEVLARLPDHHVDVVCADPMFPPRDDPMAPLGPSLEHVRWLGDARPLDAGWLREALRVARRAVIVKDVQGHDLLERLGAPTVHGRWDRAARYGCWRLDEGDDLSRS